MQTNKKYNALRIVFHVSENGIRFAVLFFIMDSSLSGGVVRFLNDFTDSSWISFTLFSLGLWFVLNLILFPVEYSSGYWLEKHYHLSNQNFSKWLLNKLKTDVLSAVLTSVVAPVIFFCMEWFHWNWWIAAGILFYVFSILLARIAPVVIFPLFYQFEPLDSETLKTRLETLCRHVGLKINGIYRFNLSKNSRKANAAFAGIGKSKRILLSDTLLAGYTEDEIEVIAAHEAGHFHHRHILKMIGLGALQIFATLGITAWIHGQAVDARQLTAIHDPTLIPMLALTAGIVSAILSPFYNGFSRLFEQQADRFALKYTRHPEAFISGMRKLSSQNLSDDSPNPVIEFLFYTHPSIQRRIAMAESFQEKY